MIKRKEKNKETNATVAYGNVQQYNKTVNLDDCINFCLQKARDNKNDSDMYLKIVKYLMHTNIPTYNWSTHPFYPEYPSITYTHGEPIQVERKNDYDTIKCESRT